MDSKIATYEEYNEILQWNWEDDSIIAQLEAEYPEFAQRQHAERDARRAEHGYTPSESKPEVLEDEIIIEGQNEIGTVVEYSGEKWLVTKCQYISEKDSADVEDGWDATIPSGRYSWLTRVKDDELSSEDITAIDHALAQPDIPFNFPKGF